MFLSAVRTLILTAPIHCRCSIDEQVMLNFSKSVLMMKQTQLHLSWPEVSENLPFWVNYSFKVTFFLALALNDNGRNLLCFCKFLIDDLSIP